MSTLGVIGCILGFLIVIYLCYKDWSVYLATFAGACVVIACNTLPFIDSLVGDYVSGMFTAVKSFFFMILFGCLQSKIYTESGAAYTIADTVMNRLLKENMSNTGKNLIGMSVILVIGTILNLGGIIAGVVIVLMYPIALVIFAVWRPDFGILGSLLFGGLYIVHNYIQNLGMSDQELFKMLPYVVTIVVLVITSMREKRESQPPAHLGLSYFREER